MNESTGTQLSGECAWVSPGPESLPSITKEPQQLCLILDCGAGGEGRASTLKGNFCSTSALGFFDGMIVHPSLGLEVGGSPSSGIRAKASCPLWDLKDGRWGSTRPGRVQDAPCPSPITCNIHGLSLCHDCWDHYLWARHS